MTEKTKLLVSNIKIEQAKGKMLIPAIGLIEEILAENDMLTGKAGQDVALYVQSRLLMFSEITYAVAGETSLPPTKTDKPQWLADLAGIDDNTHRPFGDVYYETSHDTELVIEVDHEELAGVGDLSIYIHQLICSSLTMNTTVYRALN